MLVRRLMLLFAVWCAEIYMAPAVPGAEPAMSLSESLVLRLATADLTSEPHAFPGRAVSSFGTWMSEGFLLKSVDRKLWKVTTVRQAGEFEFIHAETEGFSVRTLPWIVLFGFEPTTPQWRHDLRTTVVDFLRANVLGSWDMDRVAPPKSIGGALFLETTGGFSHLTGTCYDSFIAVVVGDEVWVGLPKKRTNDGLSPFSATMDQNTRWFTRAGVKP